MINKFENSAAVVFGANINGLSIINELKAKNVKNIILIDRAFHYAFLSFAPKEKIKIDYKKTDILEKTLKKLSEKYGSLVLFPTADFEIQAIFKIFDKIKDFCFIPFNEKNILQVSEKEEQYKFCEQLNIPYPKTIFVKKILDLKAIEQMNFPVIIKPSIKKDVDFQVFRNMILENIQDLKSKTDELRNLILKGVTFLVSEIIPGDGSNIYAYVAYRDKQGKIQNEWIGKKLSQFPDDFGVFASATNQAPEIVRNYGRKLFEAMNLYGIAEPEFKYDERDGKYKLMEINLRSMMWHRVGNLSGVNLQYTQWCDATGQKIERQSQNLKTKIHFLYAQYEL